MVKPKIRTISIVKKEGILPDLITARALSTNLLIRNSVKKTIRRNFKSTLKKTKIGNFQLNSTQTLKLPDTDGPKIKISKEVHKIEKNTEMNYANLYNVVDANIKEIFDNVDSEEVKKLESNIQKITRESGVKTHPTSLHAPRRYISYLRKIGNNKIVYDLFEIHCPKVQGSTAKLEKQQGSTKTGAFKVTFGGFGGGASFEKTMIISDEATTKNGECLKIQTELIYDTFEFEIKCMHEGCNYTSGRGKITQLKENYESSKQNPIHKKQDGCLLKPKKGFTIRQIEVGGGIRDTSFKIAKNTKMGLEAAPAGFPIQVSAAIQTLQEIKFSYSLPSKNNYRLYHKIFPKYWEFDPITN